MTPGDVGRVLALVQTFDNREVDELVTASWHAVIGDLAFDDCCQVVRDHYANGTAWLMPAHIRDGVKRIRNDRLARANIPIPDVDPDDTVAWQAALQAGIKAIADGTPPEQVQQRLEGARPMPEDFDQTFRTVRDRPPAPAQIEARAELDPAEAAAREEIRQLHATTTAEPEEVRS